MYGALDATMMVLTTNPVDQAVINALQSAAAALGHESGCSILTTGEAAQHGGLASLILEADPWSVVAIDDAAIDALRDAFGAESGGLRPGKPLQAGGGYTLVAVPGFAECLDNQEKKRVAWGQLKAARHPGNPLG